MMTKKRSISQIAAYVLLTAGALISLFPFFWMVSTSLKESNAVFEMPPQFFPNPVVWGNYPEMAEAIPVARMFLNSVIVTTAITLGQVFCCSLAGYSFARLNFPGRDTLFLVYLGTLMVPFMVTLVPSYVLMRQLGWVNSLNALIIPGLFGSAYGTFLMRQFFLTMPKELEEAALLDGCGHFGIFWRVFLPLIRPATVTLAVIAVLGAWNDFLWPMIVIQREELKTLTVGLASFQGLYGTQYSLLMAGAVVSIVPIVIIFVFGQRYFVEGITMTGMKS